MSEVIRPFNARMSKPLSPTIRRLYAEADTVVAFFDAAGVARDGKPYENTYAWFLRMSDGRIVEAHAFFDAVAFDDFWRRVTPATFGLFGAELAAPVTADQSSASSVAI